jgi:signal transduction histidine kinase
MSSFPDSSATINSGSPDDLVLAALGPVNCEPPLARLLKALARRYGAIGCVFWEADKLGDEESEPPRGYVLSSWFEGGRALAMHNVPIATSLSGAAILRNEALNSNDLSTTPFPSPPRLYPEQGITGGMACPVVLHDGRCGAVTVYRTNDMPAFTKADLSRFQAEVQIVPSLFRAMRDQQSLRLLQRVNEILADGDTRGDRRFTGDTLLPPEVTDGILHLLEDELGAVEVTLYVVDFTASVQSPQRYWMEGTTWKHEPQPARSLDIRSDRSSCTGWVLSRQQSLHVFDLLRLKDNPALYKRLHPGLEWRDSLNLETNAPLHFLPENLPRGEWPPFSYVGVPIVAGHQCVGMIRCYTVGLPDEKRAPNFFSRRDVCLLELVASRLGSSILEALRRRATETPEERKTRQAFVDLAHQLRGPLSQLVIRTQSLWEQRHKFSGDERLLNVIRGLGKRAFRVAANIRLFKTLDEGERIRVRRKVIDEEDAARLLIQLAEDNQALHAEQSIRFSVDRDSLDVFASKRVELDHGHLEQMLNNLYDNAGKYSYPDTTVMISAGITSKGTRIYFSVSNVGIPIRPHEIRFAGQRGWRSDLAEQTSGGEGSGIGLWFVRRLMLAHGGSLEVYPTREGDGRTEVRLVFPAGPDRSY